MTVPPTPDYSTQAETAEGAIRNALFMAEANSSPMVSYDGVGFVSRPESDAVTALRGVARLLRDALTKLTETK